MDLDEVRAQATTCTFCSLYLNRVQPVFSKGSFKSDILICGMCPGPDENKLSNENGQPFVGKAGKVLDHMIEDSNLTMDDVYVTNLVKCYVKPGIMLDSDWMNNCLVYLIAQIGIVQPKVIITLGADVSKFFISSTKSTTMAQLRSKVGEFLGVPIVPTYHPSYFARSGGRKHKDYNKGIKDFNKAINLIRM